MSQLPKLKRIRYYCETQNELNVLFKHHGGVSYQDLIVFICLIQVTIDVASPESGVIQKVDFQWGKRFNYFQFMFNPTLPPLRKSMGLPREVLQFVTNEGCL